jgi:surface polysaccharide O-acyltransferase-like enzyme
VSVSSGIATVNGGRQPWADLSRCVAICGVILIHSCGVIFYSYGKVPIFSWLSANLLDSSVRFSVPLFVMLSGALILKPGRDVSLTSIATRVRRAGVPLLVWSAIYLAYLSYTGGIPIDLTRMFRAPVMYHLWFVYMIVGIYLLLPLLQPIQTWLDGNASRQVYFCVLWVGLNVAPFIGSWDVASLLQQRAFLGYAGYFILGRILADLRPSAKVVGMAAVAFILAVAVTFILTWQYSDAANAPVEKAYVYFSPSVFVSAVAVFVLLRFFPSRLLHQDFLATMSDRSFLVYFMHVLVLEHVRPQVDAYTTGLPTYLSILAVATTTIAVSFVIAAALRKLPYSRAVLG